MIQIILAISFLFPVGYKKNKKPPEKIRVEQNEPQWINYKSVRNKIKDNSFYADIVNHTHSNKNWGKDKLIAAHELTHVINADLGFEADITGLYIGNNKAIKFKEPKAKLSKVANKVPKCLRGDRYNLYLIDQRVYYEDYPLYVCDEWTAYRNETLVAIEESKNLDYKMDTAIACLEFSIFSMALCMTIKEDDPQWWKDNPDFKKFVAYYLKKSSETYKRSQLEPNLQWESDYLENIRTKPEAEVFRDFAKELTGEDLF